MGKSKKGKRRGGSGRAGGCRESPAARSGHVLVSSGEGAVLTGGHGERAGGFLDVWAFSTGQWTLLHDSSSRVSSGATPLPRSMAGGCMVGRSVYLFGGMQQEGSQVLVYNDLWEFNLDSRQW